MSSTTELLQRVRKNDTVTIGTSSNHEYLVLHCDKGDHGLNIAVHVRSKLNGATYRVSGSEIVITRFAGPQTHSEAAQRLSIGDTVIVFKPLGIEHGSYDREVWPNMWVEAMDEAIGMRCCITHISSHGVTLKALDKRPRKELGTFQFPAFGLHLVLANEELDTDAPTTHDTGASTMKTEDQPMIKIEHKTYVNGTDVANLSTDAIVCIINESENTIDRLNSLRAKPKAVQTKITQLQEGIDALVKLLDERSID
jgi:hypothetical protein